MTAKQDIAIKVDPRGFRDIAIGTDGDLLATDGFDTSLDLSLMTNRRADASEVPRAEFRRGWIGDTVSRTDGFEHGSKLWLFEQKRLQTVVVAQIEDAAREALQWLIVIGAAIKVDVTASRTTAQKVQLEIVIFTGNNIVRRYFNIWVGTNAS